jgi:hypothetical protein
MTMDIEDDEWTSPENPLSVALRNHRYQPEPSDRICSCGASADSPPTTNDSDDYEWWITHLKANI